MISLLSFLMASLGSILILNARIANNASLGQWEVEESHGWDLVKINGPPRQISGGGSRNAKTRVSRHSSSSDLIVKVPNYNEETVKVGSCEAVEDTNEVDDSEWLVSTHVKCNGIIHLDSLGQIPPQMISKTTSITISNSFLTTLDFGQFQTFSALQNLSVTSCNISSTTGLIPSSVKNLNLSHNKLKSVDTMFSVSRDKVEPILLKSLSKKNTLDSPTAFDLNLSPDSRTFSYNNTDNVQDTSWTPFPMEHVTFSGKSDLENHDNDASLVGASFGRDTINDSATLSLLAVVDLSHNRITKLPRSIFYLRGLRSLRISGNHLRCVFVWERLWNWTQTAGLESILSDADETFCGVDEDVRVFQFNVAKVLQARKEFEITCSTVDKSQCNTCSLYALQREDHPITHSQSESEGNENKNMDPKSHSLNDSGNGHGISISLSLDCSSRNLTELPQVPPQTWQLNISNNFIKDLSLLKLPMYSNLIILDGRSNQVNLESLAGTSFIAKYNYLNLQNNGITSIPTDMLTSLETIPGQGITFLGGNFIDCDCNFLKEIKPLLIENSKRIRDVKDIFCKDAAGGSAHTRLMDLQYSDLCRMDSYTEFDSEDWLYIIILVETILIILIIAKVWHDQRTFRRTGVLPWCSAKMPRLPCDAILESIKEPPTFSRHTASAESSNTNIHHPSSVSHIHLKSSGSGSINSASDKIQPHVSNFASTSSRTASV